MLGMDTVCEAKLLSKMLSKLEREEEQEEIEVPETVPAHAAVEEPVPKRRKK